MKLSETKQTEYPKSHALKKIKNNITTIIIKHNTPGDAPPHKSNAGT
jgi:hypothetical protein